MKGLLDKHRASAPPTATPTPASAAPTKVEKPDKTAKVEEEKPAASAQTTKKAGSGKKTTAKGSASASAGKVGKKFCCHEIVVIFAVGPSAEVKLVKFNSHNIYNFTLYTYQTVLPIREIEFVKYSRN